MNSNRPEHCQRRRPRYAAGPRRERGFSVTELIATVLIAGVLAAAAIPSFTNAIKNNRISTASNLLWQDMALARSEAVKRGIDVTIAAVPGAGANSWTAGWTVFVDDDEDGVVDNDEEVIRVGKALSDTQTLVAVDSDGPAANVTFIRYRSTGTLNTALVAPFDFTLCDNRTEETGRNLSVLGLGRTTITEVTCG